MVKVLEGAERREANVYRYVQNVPGRRLWPGAWEAGQEDDPSLLLHARRHDTLARGLSRRPGARVVTALRFRSDTESSYDALQVVFSKRGAAALDGRQYVC